MLFDLALVILASPIFVLRGVLVIVHRYRFWRVSYQATFHCRNCDETVSLVGMWRCLCGYTYAGHLLRECPVCLTLPRMVRCFTCGITRRLPEP